MQSKWIQFTRKCLILILGLGIYQFSFLGEVQAAGNTMPYFPGQSAEYDDIIKKNKLTDQMGSLDTDSSGQFATQDKNLKDLVYELFTGDSNLLRSANRIIGIIAIIYLVVLGCKFIFARGKEEAISKYKQQFGWIVMGLAVVSAAEILGFVIMNPENDILRDGSEGGSIDTLMDKITQVRDYLRIIIGGILLIVLARAGYYFITEGDSDDGVEKQRKSILTMVLGIMIIFLAETIMYVLQNMTDTTAQLNLVNEILGLAQFLLSFIGVGALLLLALAAIYYVISFGNDAQTDKAKQLMIAAALALFLAFMMYWILRFSMITFDVSHEGIKNPNTNTHTRGLPLDAMNGAPLEVMPQK